MLYSTPFFCRPADFRTGLRALLFIQRIPESGGSVSHRRAAPVWRPCVCGSGFCVPVIIFRIAASVREPCGTFRGAEHVRCLSCAHRARRTASRFSFRLRSYIRDRSAENTYGRVPVERLLTARARVLVRHPRRPLSRRLLAHISAFRSAVSVSCRKVMEAALFRVINGAAGSASAGEMRLRTFPVYAAAAAAGRVRTARTEPAFCSGKILGPSRKNGNPAAPRRARRRKSRYFPPQNSGSLSLRVPDSEPALQKSAAPGSRSAPYAHLMSELTGIRPLYGCGHPV